MKEIINLYGKQQGVLGTVANRGENALKRGNLYSAPLTLCEKMSGVARPSDFSKETRNPYLLIIFVTSSL